MNMIKRIFIMIKMVLFTNKLHKVKVINNNSKILLINYNQLKKQIFKKIKINLHNLKNNSNPIKIN
jgi:hypothetical protein